MANTRQILFLSHGGGPAPLLGEPHHQALVDYWCDAARSMPMPDAILLISAHWESDIVRVTGGADSTLLYDYYGFPPETYDLHYPCPGEPVLAQRVVTCLQAQGIPAALDTARGLDHGVFVPLLKMYPKADIPVVEMSLLASLDAGDHIAIGDALQGLDYNHLLIIGSGFSFHNMPLFFASNKPEIEARNRVFQDWLIQTCGDGQLSETERKQRLIDWEQAPHARLAAPREEHLLPLLVCAAAAGQAATHADLVVALELTCCCFRWSL